MAWEAPTADTVLSEFTPTELASITTLMGGAPLDNTSLLGQIVATVVKEVRGYISAGNYSLDADTTKIPDGLFSDLIAISRWRLLVAVPMLKQLQTDERRLASDAAIKKLILISEQKFFVEPPIPDMASRGGNWNSENKLIMRAHPIPRPAAQFTPQINTYANPSAPLDITNTQNGGTLLVGTTYTIILYVDGDDFVNVGGTNVTGSVFTATGTTPTVWTNGSQLQA